MSCVRSGAETNLYLFKTTDEFSFLVVYVEVVLLIGNEQSVVNKVIKKFSKTFEIRVSKKIDRFFGMTINDDGVEVKLHNQPIVEKILMGFKAGDCKPVSKPLPIELDLGADRGDKLPEAPPYRPLTRALMHLTNTVRPDIAYSVPISRVLCISQLRRYARLKHICSDICRRPRNRVSNIGRIKIACLWHIWMMIGLRRSTLGSL